jgi:protein-tyrosine-phosphatase
MPKPGHILVVCTGNICRSPMAEGLLKHALAGQPEPLRSLKVLSAGVAARNGEPISENSVIALKKTGIDISDLHAQALTQELLDNSLVVFGMTESHRAIIKMRARPDQEIGDPYGGPLKVYEAARDEMVEAIPSIMAFLKKLTAKA